jgi:phosphatidylserine/phosphatidylglycerophosphate/cardiolipin synthase-like enzyme
MDEDAITTNLGTEYDHFLQEGLDVRRDGNEGMMHDKVMLIDKKIVITGSYNFTASAEDHNDENMVILHSDWIASRYVEEFQRIYDQAQP